MPTDKEVGIRRIPAYTLHYTTAYSIRLHIGIALRQQIIKMLSGNEGESLRAATDKHLVSNSVCGKMILGGECASNN